MNLFRNALSHIVFRAGVLLLLSALPAALFSPGRAGGAVRAQTFSEQAPSENTGSGRDAAADRRTDPPADGSPEELADVVEISDGRYSCSFDDVKHDYIVDLPADPQGGPLIIMLHGYGQSAESIRRATGLHRDANPLGFTVVYVTGAPDPEDRSSSAGWNYEKPEAVKNDLEFLSALARRIREQYRTDPSRCFAVGFSNGAFMCHRLAIEAADTFSAVVSVAGTMPRAIWEKRPETCRVGFFQVTGEKDDTVPKNLDGSARFARSPAMEDVIAYYAQANGLDQTETLPEGKGSLLTKYGSPSSDRQVWHLIIRDGRHSWSAESVTGINTNVLVLDFLSTQ